MSPCYDLGRKTTSIDLQAIYGPLPNGSDDLQGTLKTPITEYGALTRFPNSFQWRNYGDSNADGRLTWNSYPGHEYPITGPSQPYMPIAEFIVVAITSTLVSPVAAISEESYGMLCRPKDEAGHEPRKAVDPYVLSFCSLMEHVRGPSR
jgi:hypothetical protein